MMLSPYYVEPHSGSDGMGIVYRTTLFGRFARDPSKVNLVGPTPTAAG